MNNKEIIIKHLESENKLYGSNLKLVAYNELINDIPYDTISKILDDIYGDSNKINITINGEEYIVNINVFNNDVEIDIE